MFWSKDGTQIIWDGTSPIVKPLKVDTDKYESVKNHRDLLEKFFEAFKKIHPDKGLTASLILTACQQYASLLKFSNCFSNNSHFELLFQLFEIRFLLPSEEEIKKRLLSYFQVLFPDELSESPPSILESLILKLVYDKKDNYIDDYISAGGSRIILDHLLTIHSSNDHENWCQKLYELASSAPEATEFDKKFCDLVLSEPSNATDNNFLFRFIITIFYRFDSINVHDIQKIMNLFSIEKTNSFSFLLYCILSDRLNDAVDIVYSVTDSTFIATHFIDLIYVYIISINEKEFINLDIILKSTHLNGLETVSLQKQRELSIFRFLEILATDSFANELYSKFYIKSLKNYSQKVSQEEKTSYLKGKDNLIERTKNAGNENNESMLSQILNREFLKADYYLRAEIAKI